MQISNYPENGIAIKRFCGEKMDRELLKLADFLEKISQVVLFYYSLI